MKKYTDFIYKQKKILIVLLGLSIIFSIIGIFKIQMNTNFSLFTTENSIYEQRLDELDETFGNLDQIIVLVEHELFTDSEKLDLRLLQEELSNIDNVLQIQGVAPEFIMLNNTQTKYIDVPVNMLLTYYENFGEFSPLITETDTYYSSFTLFLGSEFDGDNMSQVEDILVGYEYDSYVSGDQYSQSKITDYILKILLLLPPLTILTILLVFRWQMGAIKPTLFSVLPAAVGSLWTLGSIGWIGQEVSMLTAIVPIFIIVIGSADGLHFMSHFQDSKLEGIDTKTSIQKTLRIVGIPMIITTLTSMVGFLSLLTFNTDSIYDLAIFSAVGIFLAGVATWLVLPIILSNEINVLPKKIKTGKNNITLYLKKVWGIPSIIFVLVIITVSIFTVKNINNEFDMLMVYKESTEVAQSAEKIQAAYGGNIPLYVQVKLDESPISLSVKDQIDTMRTELLDFEEVTKVVSPYALLDTVYSVQFDGDIPNDMVLNGLYTQLASDETNTIHNLINVEENTIRLMVFTSDLKNDTLLKLEDYTDTQDNTTITGVQYLLMDLNTTIGTMQIESILLAIGLVIIMMIITLKNFKVALLSVLPISITVLGLYGFLGISQIPLNITTVMIFSITIGVGIDYAVHYSSVYQYYKKEGYSNNEAIELSYSNSARPIITNALGISLGLSIMMLSPLTIHLNVAILMWVSMIISVVVTLTFLPTIFKIKKR